MAEMEPVTEESAPGINKPNAYISARYRQDAVLNTAAPSGNYMLAGICAILALIVYVILLGLLYGDFTALSVA
jgi:hypothetical protein